MLLASPRFAQGGGVGVRGGRRSRRRDSLIVWLDRPAGPGQVDPCPAWPLGRLAAAISWAQKIDPGSPIDMQRCIGLDVVCIP